LAGPYGFGFVYVKRSFPPTICVEDGLKISKWVEEYFIIKIEFV
jgi:hypothetical protein